MIFKMGITIPRSIRYIFQQLDYNCKVSGSSLILQRFFFFFERKIRYSNLYNVVSVQMKGVGTARTSSKTQIYVCNFNSVKYFRGFILKGSMFKQRLHGLNIYWYETCLNVCLWVDLRHRTVPLTVDMVLRKN